MAGRGRCGGSRGVAGCRGGCFHDGAECGACCLPFGRSSFDVLCCTHKEQDCGVDFGIACWSLDMEMDVHSCQKKGSLVLLGLCVTAAWCFTWLPCGSGPLNIWMAWFSCAAAGPGVPAQERISSGMQAGCKHQKDGDEKVQAHR